MSIEHPEHRTDNLPSLDETAKVPVTHSDKVHGDENWSGVQETFHGTDARLDATQSDRVLTGQRTVEEELGERAKDRKGHMPLLAGVVTTALLVGGGIFVYNKATGSDKSGTAENPAPTPDTTATAITGETPADTETDTSTAEFGINASEFANNPEALANEYYMQHNTMMIAGITQEVRNADRRFELTDREYVSEIAQPIHEDFVDKMFVSDWEENPELADYVNTLLEISLDTKEIRLKTDPTKPENTEPYERKLVLEKVTGNISPLETSVLWVDENNSALNEGEEFSTGAYSSGLTGGETLTWVNEDGKLKISNITHYDG